MNKSDKRADNPAEIATARPGSIHVHVTRIASENRNRQARSTEAEVIETTVADIAAVLIEHGIAADEPATIGIEWVEDPRVIRLSAADQRAFADGVLKPPEPAPALQRAAARSCASRADRDRHAMRGRCPRGSADNRRAVIAAGTGQSISTTLSEPKKEAPAGGLPGLLNRRRQGIGGKPPLGQLKDSMVITALL